MIHKAVLITFCSCVFNTCVSAEEDKIVEGLFDKNLDGVQDVFYEYENDGTYFELSDSNYDGKINSSCKYDDNDTIVSCRLDQNYDGLLETQLEFNLGNLVKEGVDVNGNGLYEVIFHYEQGVLNTGYKLYKNNVGQVKFDFGYPSAETLSEVSYSEEEFSKLYWNEK